MDTEITSAVPPPRRWGSGRREKYQWRRMQVGESFWTDAKSIRQVAWAAGRRLQRRYVTAREGDGVRVWRVK